MNIPLSENARRGSDLIRSPIAIVGIGCRYPGGATDPERFWTLLRDGVDAITEVPPDRWNLDRYYDPDPGKSGKTYTRWGGFIDGHSLFDARFFGISPREAARMDPQHRILLEVAYEALEDAGEPADRLAGSRTGVFIGISTFDYGGMTGQPTEARLVDGYTNLGSALSIAAARIAYAFDLRGPCLSVDTACSSSLVALHLACQSIWQGESDLALVGGVNMMLSESQTLGFCRASMLAPDGRCKPFDARANGYVRAEGAGVILLLPLERALAGDYPIYATVAGTAVNQDGRSSGITVPNRAAQEEILREAYARAGIDPGSVGYVEAHGTGTPVGDPAEAESLGRALGMGRPADRPCLIGSVKGNIGHLEAGAGIAGVIKAALALRHGSIPATLHFRKPNLQIPFGDLGLRVVDRHEPWAEPPSGPRVAGVNSFGFGGTNAHAVLVEAPVCGVAEPGSDPDEILAQADRTQPRNGGPPSAAAEGGPSLLAISARSEGALRAQAAGYHDFLTANAPPAGSALAAICRSAALHRTHHDWRLAVAAASGKDAAEQLAAFVAGERRRTLASGRRRVDAPPRVVFVFSGMGAQWWAMGRELLHDEPVFRSAVESCDRLLRPLAGWSILEELGRDEAESRIDETRIAQPAIFALQVGLAALWRSWGIHPAAVVGHSVGEVAAAHVAGALDLEGAVTLAYHRSRLQHTTEGQGGMLAAGISASEADELLRGSDGAASVAATNAPNSVTLVGEADALARLDEELRRLGRFSRFLRVRVPYHSRWMDAIEEELLASLEPLHPRATAVPLVSTVTGSRVDGAKLTADYWWRNVRQPVLFSDAIRTLLEEGADVFLEIAAHPVLSAALGECCASRGADAVRFFSLRRDEPERLSLLANLGGLYTRGVPLDWRAVHPGHGEPVRLPRYAWQHEPHWIESEASRRRRIGVREHPLLSERLETVRPTWCAEVDAQSPAYLDDHRVKGTVVFPAAAFIEMALAAGRAVRGEGPIVIDDLEIHRALALPQATAAEVQLSLDGKDPGFSINSRPIGKDAAWVQHVTGELRHTPHRAAAERIEWDALVGRCPTDLTPGECYESLHAAGLEYGPAFQALQEVYLGEDEAVAEILFAPEGEDLRSSLLFPPVLDAALQLAFLATTGHAPAGTARRTYVPVSLERLTFHRRPEHRVRCHAKCRRAEPGSFTHDLVLFDEAGEVIAEVRGMRSRALHASDAEGGRRLRDMLLRYRWGESPLTGAANAGNGTSANASASPEPTLASMEKSATEDHSGCWLVFSDGSEIAARTARRLEARGARPVVVEVGTGFERIAAGRFRIRPAEPADLDRLLEDVADLGIAYRGILHLWSLLAPTGDEISTAELLEAQDVGCLSVLHLVQALARAEARFGDGFLVVTRGSQSAAGERLSAIAATPVWGLARVLMNEAPQLAIRLVDLPPSLATVAEPAADHELDDQLAEQLLAEAAAADGEDEVAFRDGRRYVHRLEPLPAAELTRGRVRTSADSARVESATRLEIGTRGILDTLRFRAVPRPEPEPGELLIRVEAAGLNFKDVAKAMGLLDDATLEGTASGADLGLECAGTVAAVGEGVTEFRVGDRVLGFARHSLASHALATPALVAHIPDGLTMEAAATLVTVGMTAHYALNHVARIQPGERVLVHSASGGVGLAAIQLCWNRGAEVLATAGSPEKRAFLEGLGIQHVMDSRSLAFADEVMEITEGRGVDIVLNSLSGDAIARSLSVLAPFGRFIELGKRDIQENGRLGLRAFQRNLSFSAVDLDRLCVERPALATTLLTEVLDMVRAGTLAPLPLEVFPAARVVEAFRHMAQAKHIGKNVIALDAIEVLDAAEPGPLSLRPDAAYLVTGGLSGFGLATARWLAEKGARHLVLMSRSGAATPEASSAVAELTEKGVEVLVAPADVTDEAQLQAVLTGIAGSLPPLRGVVHCAMVLDDALAFQLDAERFRRVLAPKLVGGWLLHRLTRDLELDFFLSYSSVASLIGNPGQANYAAANAFLDALAEFREAAGLPGLTVNWGPIAKLGVVARSGDLEAHFARLGIDSLDPAEGLAALEPLLQSSVRGVAIIPPLAWSRLSKHLPAVAGPRFGLLATGASASEASGGETAGHDVLHRTLAAEPEERHGLIVAHLRDALAGVLGASPDGVDPEIPLTQLGLDSLMSMELATRIRTDLGAEVPPMRFVEGITLNGLAHHLAEELGVELQAASQVV